MYFVTGATGNAGREVVRALTAAGAPVRALVRRDPGDLPAGVEPVIGDLEHPPSFAGRLEGVAGAFLLAGYDRTAETLEALRAAGAERVVLLSSGSVPGGEPGNAVTRYHAEAEAAVEASGLAWTHLRPSMFAANALRWRDQLATGDVVRDTFTAVPAAVIDPADIGAVAARALLTGAHDGEALRLTGPEALTAADRLRILGDALGRDLRLDAVPDADARAELSATMPEPYVDAFLRFYVDGTLDESPVLPTVEWVLGRPPRTFAQWVAAHVDAFAAPG